MEIKTAQIKKNGKFYVTLETDKDGYQSILMLEKKFAESGDGQVELPVSPQVEKAGGVSELCVCGHTEKVHSSTGCYFEAHCDCKKFERVANQ